MRKMMLQLSLALVLAFAAGLLVLTWMSRSPSTSPQAQASLPPTVQVVVAAKIIPPGTQITPEMVAATPYLKQSRPNNSFSKVEDVVGRVALSPLSPNEPVTENRLAASEIAMGGVSALVHPGMRAMAVQGNKVLGLSGFIRPGNKVDVLVTIPDPKADNQPVTKIVLENVPVLATGEQLVPSEDGRQTSPVDVYTLEVSPEEGERLALASTQGRLHFALRNVGDEDTVHTKGADVPGTLAAYRTAVPRRAAISRPAPAPPHKVELITGGSRQMLRFAADKG